MTLNTPPPAAGAGREETPPAGPQSFVFPDCRERGTFPVRNSRGRAVARITASWTGTRFTVSTPDGQPLCAATTGWLGLSGNWQATRDDDGPLLQVRATLLRSAATVTLARGGTLLVRGSAWRRDFIVTDGTDRVVLTAAPRTSALSIHPQDYAVTLLQPVLDLTELIALVQIWRMVGRTETTSGSGVAVTSATYSG
jgi:hypothetical protein